MYLRNLVFRNPLTKGTWHLSFIRHNHFISRNKKILNDKLEKVKAVQFPERFKGTFAESWAKYWKNLFRDYVEALKEAYKSGKKEPKKSLFYISLLGFSAYCIKTNPDEDSFRDRVISYSHQLMFVGSQIRNPVSASHLKFIEDNYNQDTIQRISFGLFSIMWQPYYNDTVGLYKAQCPYLGVPYLRFYEQVIDIGFLNRWWTLESKMEEYDVNPEEWQ